MTASSHPTPSEKLAEIGARLKQAREVRAIPLHHVTARTRISERHLRAIEEGKLDLLPEPVYVRGFISKYASTLGLERLADDFPTFDPSEGVYTKEVRPASEFRPLHLYALYIGLVASTLWVLSASFSPLPRSGGSDVSPILGKAAQLDTSNAEPKLPAVPKPVPTVATPTAIVPKAVTTPSIALGSDGETSSLSGEALPVESIPNQQAKPPLGWSNLGQLLGAPSLPTGFQFIGGKPVNVGIAMTGQSWLRVVVDDEVAFEGILSEGASQTWSGERQISIRVGNAAAVSLSYNQSPLQPMGSEGEVVQQEFGTKGPIAAADDGSTAYPQ